MHIRRSPALALATGAPRDRRSKIGLRLISVCCYRCRDPHGGGHATQKQAPRADQKTMFGAILMTGFLGGAICTHFHVGEIATTPQLVSLLLARRKCLERPLPSRPAGPNFVTSCKLCERLVA